jgi:replication fork clamp-binding protein CrfC
MDPAHEQIMNMLKQIQEKVDSIEEEVLILREDWEDEFYEEAEDEGENEEEESGEEESSSESHPTQEHKVCHTDGTCD